MIISLLMVSVASLASASSLGECSPDKMTRAAVGEVCHTPTADWSVAPETYDGQRVYRDLRAGLKVTERLKGYGDRAKSESRCANGYHLPTGYPAGLNGREGFPNLDSEFATLERDGLRQVVDMTVSLSSGPVLWSSSTDPDKSRCRVDPPCAFQYDGVNGAILSYYANHSRASTLCVASEVNETAQRRIPYFERATGGELTANSPALAERRAWQRCSSDIEGFRKSCASLHGYFSVTNACKYLYTREYCPERCGTFGAGVSGTVRCDRR